MKEEELPPFNFPIEDKSERIIKVIGVGGGGGNAVQHMWEEGVKNVSFLVTNTDSQVLKANLVPNKMQIGPGLGTGGIPELGREMAEESIEDIKTMFGEETKMVFVTAGMGGGTGTGAAPVIARVAKEMGILTVGVVTLPFRMEMRKRMDKALLGMDALKKCVDSLIVINNQKLLENERYNNLTLEEGLKKADEVLTIATKTIAEIITVKGSINRDYNDVRTVMKDGGAALVSVAKASGEKRIFKALSEAISSPLVANVEKQKIRRLLYIVYSGNENPARMDELEEISEFMENFDENLDVLWGHYPDDTLGDEIKVAVVATGFDQDEEENETDEDHAKQDEMKRLKDLREKFYSCTHEVPKIEEKPQVEEQVPTTVEIPQATATEEEISEPEEEEVTREEEPKTPTFVEKLVRKLKDLMEEE
ncbi:MAG: cell division protein FtsZ [Bacteroidaceae bacterium]|nr:cell division protein FtsZ [Bacteroidaceae bacterium]